MTVSNAIVINNIDCQRLIMQILYSILVSMVLGLSIRFLI